MSNERQRTDSSLVAAMYASVKRKPSADELRKQRISFIAGSMKPDSAVTKEKIEQVLAEHEGRVPA
jgi:hypothetical protein